jgi:hypothetical protein
MLVSLIRVGSDDGLDGAVRSDFPQASFGYRPIGRWMLCGVDKR